jgi:predicted nucleic acid-binding protein
MTARQQTQEQLEAAHERVRVATLKSLIAELKRGAVREREDFGRLFAKAQRILELDDFAVSRALQISRPTVGRWARGDSAPHPLGRRPALLWLAKEAGHRLKQYR